MSPVQAPERASRNRPRSHGSVTRRKDGRWQGEWRHRDPEGRLRRLYVYASTEREAWAKVDALRARYHAIGAPARNLPTSVTAWVERWIDGRSCGVGQKRSYRGVLRNHIAPAIGHLRLTSLNDAHVLRLFERLQERGLGAGTRRQVHLMLRGTVRLALKRRAIVDDPMDGIVAPTVPKRDLAVWDADEVRRFLMVAADDELYPLYLTALGTGMRQGELFGLQWRDVDLERGTVALQRSLDRETRMTKETKTGGKRRIDLPQFVTESLSRQRARLAARDASLVRPDAAVFSSARGERLHGSNVTRRSFQPLIDLAKVPFIRFHDLRHTHATLLLLQGVHPKVVSERLGHGSIKQTMDTYSHVLPTLQRDAASKLHDILSVEGRTSAAAHS